MHFSFWQIEYSWRFNVFLHKFLSLDFFLGENSNTSEYNIISVQATNFQGGSVFYLQTRFLHISCALWFILWLHNLLDPSTMTSQPSWPINKWALIDLLFVGSVLQRHCENTFWAGIGVGESKVGWMYKVIGLHVNFFGPKLIDKHV
jgi:hypothetical protein